ncbi:uncharacterized protein DUF547 [Gillisia mitskevichiae]|uniref:Uncharacterized protein DUF547 n=1 Tax=Gillisia mitskevichiae TaxID=270921 RepID=A0A495PVA3_9FLAO|nr:DUF547 domain-containing protein [Gillisia mitskevichiae]RKS55114.1 uncharacterized protein DUF547 [Gillisia mitskevichiae]
MKFFSLLILLISSFSFAQESSKFLDASDDFLKHYVSNGRVKYAEIKQNPNELQELLSLVKQVKVSTENPDAYKAFWINAYNIAVINGIVKQYPVKSPMDIEGFFSTKTHSLGQKSVTLDDIEKKFLLGNYPEEARFHFVLVCAAIGCPPIITEAYRPETLEKQLQQQAVKAMNSSDFVKIQKDKVLLSELMKWYQKDFTRKGGTLLDYVNKYRNTPIPDNLKIEFYNYNWDLNAL